MGYEFLVCRAIVLEKVLDEVDASTGRIELVAQRYIGWARGGAETTMDTITEDFFRFGDCGIG